MISDFFLKLFNEAFAFEVAHFDEVCLFELEAHVPVLDEGVPVEVLDVLVF